MSDNEGLVHFRVVRFIYEAGLYSKKSMRFHMYFHTESNMISWFVIGFRVLSISTRKLRTSKFHVEQFDDLVQQSPKQSF